MRVLKLLLSVLLILSFLSCKKSTYGDDDSSSKRSFRDVEIVSEEEDPEDVSQEKYPDNTYCADIEYYNPDTGARNTYSLNVEVENNEVIVIHWPNGGWLDSTHFSPEELDDSGSCSFSSYDGKQYDIQITGSECSYTDNVRSNEDDNGSYEDNSETTDSNEESDENEEE